MASKRGHGEGSIVQLSDGRWQGRVRYTDSATGRQYRPSVYGKTAKEAREKLKLIIKDLEKGVSPASGKITFGEWLDYWLENHIKRHSRLTTWENYETIARIHIKPLIGQIRLTRLQTSNLQRLYNQKLDNGRNDKKGGLSAKTVGLIHLVCSSSLKQAIREKMLSVNAADAATVPRKVGREIQPMNEEQIRQFLIASKNDRLFVAFYLLISTGLRRGELLGLKWSDIDMEAGTLHVQRSLVKTNTEQAKFHPTKTAKSQRLVSLHEDVLEELRQHKNRQDIEKAKLGDLYANQLMVFCREDGMPLYPDVLDNRFHALLTKAELPHFRIHDLRHTFATMMLKQDVHAKVVQEILGHSTIGVTLDTYSHVLPGITSEAMGKMQAVIRNA
ncbi:MAG: site-specific integrase [Sporomusaceae bacterium]|nr:site-specific integrase [Sporomusaceae bacterium]